MPRRPVLAAQVMTAERRPRIGSPELPSIDSMPEQVGLAVSQITITADHVEDLAQQHLPLAGTADLPESCSRTTGDNR